MAEALVGGAVLSAFLQVLFDRLASPQVVDFFKGRKVGKSLLRRLKATMVSVNGLLDDAEEKQFTDPNVKAWLDLIRDAVLQTDDMVADISLYKALRSQSRKHQVLGFLSSRNIFKKSMKEKLEGVCADLEQLVQQKDDLDLTGSAGKKTSPYSRPTTSLVNESEIYGRGDDKEAIMKLLLDNGNNLDVIPIVGLCGVGKTALAQLVFNDSKMQTLFDLKAWVYVPAKSEVNEVTKDILEEFTKKTCDGRTFNQLQTELRDFLREQKFFLVLDDVWNSNYDDWIKLREPLRCGKAGSKIIVTTCDESVAKAMGTIPKHHFLKELSDDHCCLLFEKHAFNVGNSVVDQTLAIHGKEIARKCKGLPLAAISLAGLLRFETNVYKWKEISSSNIWNPSTASILPALRLSYHYLPPHLKRCFAYCAIFPKGYVFRKEELVLLWMAEGLLVQSKGNKDMREAGDEYFDNLVSRSFFQRLGGSHFIMHNLTNDLAKFVSGEFCFHAEVDDLSSISTKVRHLSFARTRYDSFEKFRSTDCALSMRTFLPVGRSGWWKPKYIDNRVLSDLLPIFTRLRAVSLSEYDNLVQLPDSINKLKHLRYLNLFGTSIKRLPDTVTSLLNLQILILCGCKDLIELPADMACLINLLHLDIRGTNLKEMPPNMSKLICLQLLTNFVLGRQRGSNLSELGTLERLRGKLSISNLQNADSGDAQDAKIMHKVHLKELDLKWDSDSSNNSTYAVLDKLKPPKSIERLVIIGYGDTRFPNWVGQPSFANLVALKLSGCRYCSSLPPLGQLAALKDLLISAFDQIVVVDVSFYGNSTSMQRPFESLESLKFERMPRWLEWSRTEAAAFPNLRVLGLIECPNLLNLPCQFSSLVDLEMEGCQQLGTSFPAGLHTLRISRCPSLESLFAPAANHREFSSLTLLEIWECDNLASFPRGILSAPNIKRLRLRGCPRLKSLPESLNSLSSLVNLEVVNCPEIESFPQGGLPSQLKSLEIQGCRRLVAGRTQWALISLSSLSHVVIGGMCELRSFPEENLLPPALISLKIWDIQNLEYLDERGLQHLTSLRELEIWNCPELQFIPIDGLPSLASLRISDLQNLQSLGNQRFQNLTSLRELEIINCPVLQSIPTEGMLSSLSSLTINYCPLLKQWCQREEGEDWSNISHISHVEIDYDIISERKQ